MPEHYWKGCGWRKTKRLRNASQIVIRTTFPVLRIVGYQEHALRNVQPRQQRAKMHAIDSNSSFVSWTILSARWQSQPRVLAK
jgi:hypothetical protein